MSRAYGWTPDGQIVDDEADILRAAARWVADNKPIRQYVADLNERGIRTVSGAEWKPVTLTRALRNPRIIGQQQLPDGTLIDNPRVQAIIDPNLYGQVQQVLGDADRQKFTPTARRPLLLSGLIRCAACGSPAHGNAGQYMCSGCKKVRIHADIADHEISVQALARLTTPAWITALGDAIRDRDHWQWRSEQAAQRMIVLAETFGADDIERAAFEAGIAAARAARAEADAALTAADVALHLPEILTDETVIGWWQDAPFDARRDVVRLIVDHIDLHPRKGRPTPADRLSVTWR